MKNFLLVAVTVMMVLSCNGASEKRQNITYTLAFDEANPKLVNVKLAYTMQDQGLSMTYGADQFEDRWATFIKQVQASSDGQALKVSYESGANWQVHGKRGQKVIIEYQFSLDHESHEWSGGIEGIAYQSSNSAFISGRSLFVFPSGENHKIIVEFKLPTGWGVATPWVGVDNELNQFRVEGIESLTRSGFVVGRFKQFTIERSDYELTFALSSEQSQLRSEEFRLMGQGVFDYYIQLMGGVPKIGSGEKKSLIIIGNDDRTDGEVLGNTISILLSTSNEPMEAMIGRFIFAHEFFHLWNGKSINAKRPEMEWFVEGVTNYYTLKAMRHIEVLDDQAFYDVMNNLFYQKYINDRGLADLALIDGEAKHDHWGIIYGGGMFAGMAQDLVIRSETQNEKSLDDVMRSLFDDFGGTDQLVTLEELKARLADYSGKDQSDFFEKYVENPSIIPISDYLNKGGMKSESANKKLTISANPKASDLEKKVLAGFLGEL